MLFRAAGKKRGIRYFQATRIGRPMEHDLKVYLHKHRDPKEWSIPRQITFGEWCSRDIATERCDPGNVNLEGCRKIETPGN